MHESLLVAPTLFSPQPLNLAPRPLKLPFQLPLPALKIFAPPLVRLEFAADEGAGNGADTRADCCAGTGMPGLTADDRT
jgi:hypothetical protein